MTNIKLWITNHSAYLFTLCAILICLPIFIVKAGTISFKPYQYVKESNEVYIESYKYLSRKYKYNVYHIRMESYLIKSDDTYYEIIYYSRGSKDKMTRDRSPLSWEDYSYNKPLYLSIHPSELNSGKGKTMDNAIRVYNYGTESQNYFWSDRHQRHNAKEHFAHYDYFLKTGRFKDWAVNTYSTLFFVLALFFVFLPEINKGKSK